MKSGYIHSIIDGKGAYQGKSYFFNEDRYFRYDWSLDRATDGYPVDNSAWGLPMGKSIDASINGMEEYEGKGYFFIGDKYYRFDWNNDSMDEGYPGDLSAWGFPSSFSSGIDGAVNGKASYKGKAYFFKGNQYIRYDWKADAVDSGYPQNLSAWKLPAPFSSGIDAVVNGQGAYEGKLYFFKGNKYLRYDWATDKVEKVNTIAGNWPLLVELIQFGLGRKKVYEWMGKMQLMLTSYLANLKTGTAFSGNKSLFELALSTHFKINSSMPKANKIAHLETIDSNYKKVKSALENTDNVRGRNLDEAKLDQGVDSSGVSYPAYTFFDSSMNFTNTFTKFGPLCQAAMVLHEPIHFVDSAATVSNDFYEHGSGYSTMNVNQAVHNPSSYVCFAQHLFYGSDTRYGAGKPNL